jgi:hypothetical protein
MPFDSFVWSCLATACLAVTGAIFVVFCTADRRHFKVNSLFVFVFCRLGYV